MKYTYKVFHAEAVSILSYSSDKEIIEAALNSPKFTYLYESDTLLSESECVKIVRFRSICNHYVTECKYYVLQDNTK